MKAIFATIIFLSQASLCSAQEALRVRSYENNQCTKQFCAVPARNAFLKKYCSQAPKEFQDAVTDWGPDLPMNESQTCWCSCKFDVDQT